jgi:hypothetical protein
MAWLRVGAANPLFLCMAGQLEFNDLGRRYNWDMFDLSIGEFLINFIESRLFVVRQEATEVPSDSGCKIGYPQMLPMISKRLCQHLRSIHIVYLEITREIRDNSVVGP